MKNPLKMLVLMLLTGLLMSCQEQQNVNQTRSKILTASKAPLHNNLYYSGTLKPLHVLNVPAPAEAVVESVNFQYGQSIQKGQLLATLNSDQLEKEYNTALTEYLSAKDKLESAKTKYKSSKELERLGIISEEVYKSDKSEFDNANLNYLRSLYSIQNILKAANGSFEAIEGLKISNIAEVDKALRVKYNNVKIYAKTSGIALLPPKKTSSDDGKVVPGEDVKRGQILVAIGDLNGVSLDISVTEIDIDKIKVGDPVYVTGIAFPGIKLQGTIESLDSQAGSENNMTGGLPSFRATIVVPKLTEKEKQAVRVGMSAKIQLANDAKEALLIPIKAVHRRDGKSWVTVVNNGSQVDVPVTTGESTAQQVEIIAGLKPGDHYLVSDGESA